MNLMNPHAFARIAIVLTGLAVGYGVMPLDLIPDPTPSLGLLDDASIMGALGVVAVGLIKMGRSSAKLIPISTS